MKKYFIPVLAICFSGLLLAGLLFFGSRQAFAPLAESGQVPASHRAEPSGRDYYDAVYSFAKRSFDSGGRPLAAGIAPHHLLAGDMIAEFYDNLDASGYDTIVLLGPNHFDSGRGLVIASDRYWQTPFGALAPALALLAEIRAEYPGLELDPDALEGEHSVSSHAGFIKKTFPQAKFLPLILRADTSAAQAQELARVLAEASGRQRIFLVASLDFAHEAEAAEAAALDRTSLAAIGRFDYGQVYSLAVDSPPALYAAMKYAEAAGTGFAPLNNSNSALLAGQPDIKNATSYISGYFLEPDIRFLFFGDLMLDRHVKELLAQKGLGHILGQLDEADFFSGYDLVGANLEGAVTDAGAHYEPVRLYDFAFSPDAVAGLKRYRFNFFNLANNHIDDQGQRGMDETRQNLDRLGFFYSGDADGVVSKHSGTVLEIKGRTIGLLGLSDLWGALDADAAVQAAAELAASSSFLLVNIHWGEEYRTQAGQRQKDLARRLIDAGADAVIGHHPHVVQEVEEYQGKPIFYSLGNFIFDQYFSPETQEGLAAEIVFNGQGLVYKAHRLVSRQGRIFLDD